MRVKFVVLFALIACASARELQQTGNAEKAKKNKAATPAGAAANTTFPTWAEAIQAAATVNTTKVSLKNITAAVEAAGLVSALNSTLAWTILAPTDKAFKDRLSEDLNITVDQLLLPANNQTLLKVLSYHVIPAGAITSAQLTNGQNLTTALTGAGPITVELKSGKKPRFVGATNAATVVAADVKIGASVVHVVNDVLLPAGVGKGKGKRGDDN